MSAGLELPLDISPLTPVIGAEVKGIDLRDPLDAPTIKSLHAALHKWRVIFLRDQDITDDQFLAFGRTFGPLTPAHPIAKGMSEHPEIWERKATDYKTRRNKGIQTAQPSRDHMGWHIDITFVANPNKYSILRGVEIPPYGGDTIWANLVEAYNGLSQKVKTLIDDLKAVHRTSSYDSMGSGDEPRRGPFVSLHPLVRVHPDTGEKLLFLNPGTTTHIIGLRERESQALLDLLIGEVTRPEYAVRFHWSPNAIAIWDNQATAHAGPIDYAHFDLPRVVRRITVAGDLPQGPDGFRSQALEGELFGVIG